MKLKILKEIHWTRLWTYFPTGYTCKAKTDVPNSKAGKKQIRAKRQKENIQQLAKFQPHRATYNKFKELTWNHEQKDNDKEKSIRRSGDWDVY